MSLSRILAVMKRLFFDLRNDHRTMGLMLVAPIMAMLIFGVSFGGDLRGLKIVVVNNDEGYSVPFVGEDINMAQAIITNLDKEIFSIYETNDLDAAKTIVSNGGAYAVLYFPAGMSTTLIEYMLDSENTNKTAIQLFLDKSSINVSASIMKSLSETMLDMMKEQGREPPLTIDSDHAIYGQGIKFMDAFVPAIMSSVVFLLTTLLTLLSFVGERTTGTLDRLLTTPIKESELVMGYAATFGIIGMGQVALLLATGVLCFGITIVGNVFIAFLVVATLAIVSQALGILISSLAQRPEQAIQFIPFIVLPAFLFAGIFWPIESIPEWLRPLCYLVPPYYAVDACRAVMVKGWGLEKVWIDILGLFAFAGLCIFLATQNLKQRRV